MIWRATTGRMDSIMFASLAHLSLSMPSFSIHYSNDSKDRIV
jgi:hypothetical protein